MFRLRLAVATAHFGLPIRKAIPIAAAMGADGLQLDARQELPPGKLSETGRREFMHLLQEFGGLKVAGLRFPTRRSYYDSDQLDGRIAATRSAMEFASQLRASVLTLKLGPIPESESANRELLTQVVSDPARHGNHVGTTIAVAPSGDAPETLREFIDTIATGPIGVDFDPAAVVMAGHNPADAFRVLHRQIISFRARDGVRDFAGTGQEVAVGRGEVDWDTMLPLLDEAGYAGWLTVERQVGDDRQGDAARAIQFVRNVAHQ